VEAQYLWFVNDDGGIKKIWYSTQILKVGLRLKKVFLVEEVWLVVLWVPSFYRFSWLQMGLNSCPSTLHML
jgi:hypothetical protein